MVAWRLKSGIVVDGVVYAAVPMDDCEQCAFYDGLAKCSQDFICITTKDAIRKGFRNRPMGFVKWRKGL